MSEWRKRRSINILERTAFTDTSCQLAVRELLETGLTLEDERVAKIIPLLKRKDAGKNWGMIHLLA